MEVNLLKKGEKITDFGWGIARKKPIEIIYREVTPDRNFTYETIFTREGTIRGYPEMDYVIRGVQGELYPIKKDIFHATYDVIEKARSSKESANNV